MKFSNGTPADPEQLKRQGAVSVAWQSVVLDEVAAPSLSDRDAKVRDSLQQSPAFSNARTITPTGEATVSDWPTRNNTQMALTVKDDLIGVPVTVDESRNNAHAITLHSQSVDVPIMGSSLVLASDAVNEVVNIYLQQAQAYCDEDQWEKAFEACQEILKVAPATAEAYKFLGKILQQQGRPTDAMGFYAKAITLRPNFPEVYSNLGSIYAQKGKWEEAVAYYKKAIERDPELAVAYLNLAKIWKKLGRKESELKCQATALRLQPNLGSAKDHFTLAQTLESTNNPEGAILFYQQAVDQDPKMVSAYQRLADLLEDTGDWQGAAVCYRKVLQLNAEAEKAKAAQLSAGKMPLNLSPEDQQKMHKLLQASSTKQVIGNVSTSAQPPSQPQLSLSPAEAATLSPTELAQRYAAAKDWPRAIECLQSAIAQSPQSAILYRSLAKLFEENKNPKLAAEAWYRSFVLEPSWPDAQQCFTLGRVLARYGNSEEAVLCYRQSLQLQPEFLPAREALDALRSSPANNASQPSQPNADGGTATSSFLQQAVTSKK